MIYVFDLDGTVIDSSHRYTAKADGTINLRKWIDMCTPELIAKDKLLPLVHLMRKLHQMHTILVCTARVLCDDDYGYFLENDIRFHVMLDRPQGCIMADDQLKEVQLRLYAHSVGISWVKFCQTSLMYDDNRKIINHMHNIGLTCNNANVLNRSLA